MKLGVVSAEPEADGRIGGITCVNGAVLATYPGRNSRPVLRRGAKWRA